MNDLSKKSVTLLMGMASTIREGVSFSSVESLSSAILFYRRSVDAKLDTISSPHVMQTQVKNNDCSAFWLYS